MTQLQDAPSSSTSTWASADVGNIVMLEHVNTCIDDQATATLMVDKDIWLSTQPFVGEDDTPPLTGQSRINLLQVIGGTNSVYALSKEHKIKTAWGTDVLFSRALAQRQGAILASLVRWHTPAQALAMATGTNAELLALSGKRNPYPGKLGVIEEGALADLLIVDGNPLENINLIADPAKNLKVIMKDGAIFKNTLSG